MTSIGKRIISGLKQFTEKLEAGGSMKTRTMFGASTTDVLELIGQIVDADDADLRAEIGQTLREIITPETMIVKMRKEYELSHPMSSTQDNRVSDTMQQVERPGPDAEP